ncbi:type II CAAX prenyl endopeptidase Rce1 family protein [Hornefia butyriciproducens]|uniref:CPBP family glutamic-type intramembrane protease n=2 Tax=Hornefia butyriciproducens TaxID=2652293 RepID=UPI0023EF7A69|nr:CPBP family glutamic-type intramembrane protease [Hornefia butyriciproducens]MDD6298446.1 CPBP family glutamic-type intramembrane protease [Hornefia butyriciproducens]MDY6211778.1 CPBP family glutamic-type intramembrane protease [Hornefia butyriciproducens]
MNGGMNGMIITIIAMLICSVIMGRILFWIDGTKFVSTASRRLMNRIPWDYEEIKASFIGIWYYIVPLAFTAGFSVLFDFNPLNYLLLKLRYIGWIPLTILAELSMVTMLSGCLTLFSDRTDWSGEIGNISWIKSVQKRNKAVVPLVPVLGALVEEVFFRGTVFLILFTRFDGAGFLVSFLASGALFAVEQVLFTDNRNQRLSMCLASVGIAFVACVSTAYTGSFLPCLLAHECFLVFYFGRFRYY